jgi:hypothetical protein
VECDTLDAYAARSLEGGPLRLLKIDVEGHELNVLDGARCMLTGSTRPELIMLEVSARGDNSDRLLYLLRAMGYELRTVGARGTLRAYRPMSPERTRWARRFLDAAPSGAWNRVRRLYWSYRTLDEVVAVRVDCAASRR